MYTSVYCIVLKCVLTFEAFYFTYIDIGVYVMHCTACHWGLAFSDPDLQ